MTLAERALKHPCPVCIAESGQRCIAAVQRKNRPDLSVKTPHRERLDLARSEPKVAP